MCSFKIIVFVFLISSHTHAYNFKLCCPFAHQYNSTNETCFPSQEPQHLKIFNLTEEVDEISGKVLNIINYEWCRNKDGLRNAEEISEPYYLQEDGKLYVQDEYFKSNRFCLNINEFEDEYIPILCKFEVDEPSTTTTIEYSTIKTNFPTTSIPIDKTSTEHDCICNSEPPKFPEIFCENLIEGTFEKCVKCTIENTCNKEDCTSNISLIEFVDVLKDTINKHTVQVNKKKCPFWKYTYNLNKNDTIHISILNQTCDELKNTNTKASFNTGILLYVGLAFLIIVVLGLLGIVVYFIKQRRIDAAQYTAFVKQLNTPETEVNPMYRPSTVIYKLPDEVNFK